MKKHHQSPKCENHDDRNDRDRVGTDPAQLRVVAGRPDRSRHCEEWRETDEDPPGAEQPCPPRPRPGGLGWHRFVLLPAAAPRDASATGRPRSAGSPRPRGRTIPSESPRTSPSTPAPDASADGWPPPRARPVPRAPARSAHRGLGGSGAPSAHCLLALTPPTGGSPPTYGDTEPERCPRPSMTGTMPAPQRSTAPLVTHRLVPHNRLTSVPTTCRLTPATVI